jgi:hypothetical protein
MKERLKKMEGVVGKLLKTVALYAGLGILGLAEELRVKDQAEQVAKRLKVQRVNKLISLDVEPEGDGPRSNKPFSPLSP